MPGLGFTPSVKGVIAMGERLKRIIAKQAELRERLAAMTEQQIWQDDYDSAEISQFAESCLPQKPLVNLNHINIEDWEDED